MRNWEGSILGAAVIVVSFFESVGEITRRIHPVAAPTLQARAHSGPSYTTLLDSTGGRAHYARVPLHCPTPGALHALPIPRGSAKHEVRVPTAAVEGHKRRLRGR